MESRDGRAELLAASAVLGHGRGVLFCLAFMAAAAFLAAWNIILAAVGIRMGQPEAEYLATWLSRQLCPDSQQTIKPNQL